MLLSMSTTEPYVEVYVPSASTRVSPSLAADTSLCSVSAPGCTTIVPGGSGGACGNGGYGATHGAKGEGGGDGSGGGGDGSGGGGGGKSTIAVEPQMVKRRLLPSRPNTRTSSSRPSSER